jgi:hypothetical protein
MMPLMLLLLSQESRDVFMSDRPVEIRVPISSEAQHRATVVSFPEESLEALVAGWNEGDLSIECRRENLFIKLLRKAQGDVHVVGASGALYRLRIVPAEDSYDGRVRILPARNPKRDVPEAVDLLRAMRLGRKPVQGSVLRSDQPLMMSAEWTTRVVYVYESAAYRGFVARLENISPVPLRIDPSRFLAKDLVMVGSREMLLSPGEKTLLYLVFWKAP